MKDGFIATSCRKIAEGGYYLGHTTQLLCFHQQKILCIEKSDIWIFDV